MSTLAAGGQVILPLDFVICVREFQMKESGQQGNDRAARPWLEHLDDNLAAEGTAAGGR